MSFHLTVRHRFPAALPQREYVSLCTAALHRAGLIEENTLVAISRCRDEITSSLVRSLEVSWGRTFELASLAGMLTVGAFGLQAAISHIPRLDDRGHLVVFATSHVGIDDDGTIGQFRRDHITDPVPTCGALFGVLEAMQRRRIRRALDVNDLEQSRLETRLGPLLGEDHRHDLADLAQLTLRCIEEDLTLALRRVVGNHPDRPLGIDGALFTGIQVHGPYDRTLVAPSLSLIEIDGEVTAALPDLHF